GCGDDSTGGPDAGHADCGGDVLRRLSGQVISGDEGLGNGEATGQDGAVQVQGAVDEVGEQLLVILLRHRLGNQRDRDVVRVRILIPRSRLELERLVLHVVQDLVVVEVPAGVLA